MDTLKNRLPLLWASSIHEIKNNINELFIHIECLVKQCELKSNDPMVATVQSVNKILSHRLNQFLASYKTSIQELQVNIDQHAVEDLFEEVVIHHKTTEIAYNAKISAQCDEDLCGFFDFYLIHNILDTAIYNAVQASAKNILIRAEQEQGFIKIIVTDDGPGFPESMLTCPHTPQSQRNLEHTGLGLYLAEKIAASHQNNELQGYIELFNLKSPTGACLNLYIP